jgi:hypothetical protein
MKTDAGRPAADTRLDVHDEALALLPWRVNGSLDDAEAARIDEHLRICAACRRESEAERRLYDSIRSDVSSVDHAPQASFEKLWSRIEEVDRDVPRDTAIASLPLAAADLAGRASPPRAWTGPQRWLLAASLLLAFGAGLFAASLWNPFPSGRAPQIRTATTTASDSGSPAAAATGSPAPAGVAPEFRTATSAMAATPAEPAVRAVFAPSTTVEELTRILRETRLTIIAGPSESGVCTLALDPDGEGSVESALSRLRADPRVRFAEPAPGTRAASNR